MTETRKKFVRSRCARPASAGTTTPRVPVSIVSQCSFLSFFYHVTRALSFINVVVFFLSNTFLFIFPSSSFFVQIALENDYDIHTSFILLPPFPLYCHYMIQILCLNNYHSHFSIHISPLSIHVSLSSLPNLKQHKIFISL
jgi:hypothetical protein